MTPNWIDRHPGWAGLLLAASILLVAIPACLGWWQ